MSYGTVQAEKMTTESGYSLGAGNASSFKNRLINGAQVIDQRNNGSSVTPTIDGQYLTDRFNTQCSSIRANVSFQQVDVPAPLARFTKALKFTANSASTVGASDFIAIGQTIEGYNWADLNWGTSNAKDVTFSCWVYGSITGTFGGLLKAFNQGRTYPFLYTISSANTWTQISVTIPGDTSGTWEKTNSGAVWMELSLACGSTYTGPPLAWNSSVNVGATGQSNAYATTAGATFYTTGWQIEAGTVATSFDFRPYGTELQLCERYYEKTGFGHIAMAESGSTYVMNITYRTTKRTQPSIGLYTTSNIRVRQFGVADRDATSPSATSTAGSTNGGYIKVSGFSAIGSASTPAGIGYTTSSENGDLFYASAEL